MEEAHRLLVQYRTQRISANEEHGRRIAVVQGKVAQLELDVLELEAQAALVAEILANPTVQQQLENLGVGQ